MRNKNKKNKRNESGTVLVESAIVIPVFLLVIFGCFELSRMMYAMNTCGIAAEHVAYKIGFNIAPYGNTISTTDFDTYASEIRFPGTVLENAQFSYDILDANNVSVLSMGQAIGAQSKKVVVTCSFPPPNFPEFKIPMFDPGTLVNNGMMFPAGGIQLMSSATALIQYSRRTSI